MPTVSAVTLPDHLSDHQLNGCVVAVIDVLRATTTIAQALQNDASCVIPVASVESARMLANENRNALLCGERGGVKPDGFALGNSPAEYTPDLVQGRDLVLTTTNGTRALQLCTQADRVITTSITNLDAAATFLKSLNQDIMIVCSGTDRKVSLEDAIAAGLLADSISDHYTRDDAASLLIHAARDTIQSSGSLAAAIASSFHAKRLQRLGFESDVLQAAQRGTSTIIPEFDVVTGEIRPASKIAGMVD